MNYFYLIMKQLKVEEFDISSLWHTFFRKKNEYMQI